MRRVHLVKPIWDGKRHAGVIWVNLIGTHNAYMCVLSVVHINRSKLKLKKKNSVVCGAHVANTELTLEG
jgi:hypothetical protein